MPSPADPVSVALLALPETTPGALYGLYEVFAAVGVAWGAITGETAACRRMAPRIVAARPEPFVTTLGTPLVPQAAIAEVPHCDVVIVTDLDIAPATELTGRWPEEAAWVRARYNEGAMVCSVCTGSIFLAEAGLLDGLEATTHWSTAGLFRARYPAVRLRPERILCPAGEGHRILTGGGSSSWQDLALALIGRFCGAPEAVRIAKLFVLGDRSDGQLPFATMSRPAYHEDAVIADCQTWLADHYAAPNPVRRLVERSGLPERTFKRRFKAATGYTPVEYVQSLRVEEAKQLLETTDEPTDAVALAVGYEDPAYFRRLFKRSTGITPARYRQRFRLIGTLQTPDHAMA